MIARFAPARTYVISAKRRPSRSITNAPRVGVARCCTSSDAGFRSVHARSCDARGDATTRTFIRPSGVLTLARTARRLAADALIPARPLTGDTHGRQDHRHQSRRAAGEVRRCRLPGHRPRGRGADRRRQKPRDRHAPRRDRRPGPDEAVPRQGRHRPEEPAAEQARDRRRVQGARPGLSPDPRLDRRRPASGRPERRVRGGETTTTSSRTATCPTRATRRTRRTPPSSSARRESWAGCPI